MKGFVRIDKLSLQQCACLLSNETDSIKKQALESQCKLLIKERNKQEEKEFKECKTIADYDRFLKEYDVDYYSMLHKDDVNKEIEKIIADISLQGYYELLLEDSMRPYAERIKKEIDKHLPIWQKEEKFAYEQCKTINDYEQFITKYSKYASFYAMQYKVAAEQKIEDLFWEENNSSIRNCRKYLARYPEGQYASKAHYIIRRNNIIPFIILLLMLIIFATISTLGYNSGDITVSSDSLRFSKYGGEQTITITTNGKIDGYIERCNEDSEEWLSISKINNKITFTASPNSSPKRIECITISVYPTWYGEIVFDERKIKKKVIYISQESGITTDIQINHTNSSEYPSVFTQTPNGSYIGKIECKTYHHTSNTFKVTTDGVEELFVTSSQNWIDIIKENDSIYVVLTRENEDFAKEGEVTFRAGGISRKIAIYQPSGFAKRLNVSVNGRYAEWWILPAKGNWDNNNTDAIGGEVKRFNDYKNCPYVYFKRPVVWKISDIRGHALSLDVDCDGYWTIEDVPEWMYAQLNDDEKGRRINFLVRPNTTGIEREIKIKIRTSSGIEKWINLSQPSVL